jgi:hypothetical protein
VREQVNYLFFIFPGALGAEEKRYMRFVGFAARPSPPLPEGEGVIHKFLADLMS